MAIPPRFTFYPLSIEQTCETVDPEAIDPQTNAPLPIPNIIGGLGVPPSGYGTPPWHAGTDFFAPTNSRVFSIGDNGLVVGIGATNEDRSGRGLSTYVWGAAYVENNSGYSVIVRYGHLYVLYGHLNYLEPTIFVGAPLAAGIPIGRIGKVADAHVHIEIHNFNSPIDSDALQSSPNSLRQLGILSFASDLSADRRAPHHYDLMQFFGEDVRAWSDDSVVLR